MGETLRRTDKFWLLISVGMIVPITILRAVRFRLVAPPAALSGVGEALRLTLVSTALNVFVPAKAGDLVKSYFVAKRGGTSPGVAVAIIVYERLCDMFSIVFWCLVGWLVSDVGGVPCTLGCLAGARSDRPCLRHPALVRTGCRSLAGRHDAGTIRAVAQAAAAR